MKKELLYTFFISIFGVFASFSQEETKQNQQRYGLRFGADISKVVRSFIDKDYWGAEIVADYRWNYRLYLATEIGKEKKFTPTDYFDFTTNGQYLKLGADYNTYNNWYGMENMISVGTRYGFSLFDQELNSYKIHTLHNEYWQEDLVGKDLSVLNKYTGRTAHWIEFVLGMKVELLRNFYAGASIRFSALLYHKQDDFPNFWIPGVQRVWEKGTIGINYNYTLTYMIPFYTKNKQRDKNDK